MGPTEHSSARLAERFFVYNDFAEVAHDIVGPFAHSDAAQNRAFDAAGQFLMHVAGEDDVVVGHEIEGIGIYEREYAGTEFFDTARRQIPVERQLRRGKFADAVESKVRLAERIAFRRRICRV